MSCPMGIIACPDGESTSRISEALSGDTSADTVTPGTSGTTTPFSPKDILPRSMTESLLTRALVPIANEEDATATAAALRQYLGGDETVIGIHVIEKAGGAPDKASVEQREREATEIFGVFGAALEDIEVETEIRYGTDVAETIIDASHDLKASGIVFTPRGGSRWVKLLTGDVTTSLLNRSDRPVVVLPDSTDEE